jgi:hypothetical protein
MGYERGQDLLFLPDVLVFERLLAVAEGVAVHFLDEQIVFCFLREGGSGLRLWVIEADWLWELKRMLLGQ